MAEIEAAAMEAGMAETLRRVAAGERFTVTVRGVPVAELAPRGAPAGPGAAPERTPEERAGIRAAIDGLRAFRAAHPPPPGAKPLSMRALVEEGRKH